MLRIVVGGPSQWHYRWLQSYENDCMGKLNCRRRFIFEEEEARPLCLRMGPTTRRVLRENLLQESRSLKSLASRERLHARDREIKAFLSTFFKHFFMREAASTVLVWMLLLLLSGWKHGVGKKVNYLSVLLCPAHCTAHCSTARTKFCAFFVWAHRQAG